MLILGLYMYIESALGSGVVNLDFQAFSLITEFFPHPWTGDCVSPRIAASIYHGGYLSNKIAMRIGQNSENRAVDRDRFRSDGRVFLFGLPNLSYLSVLTFFVEPREKKMRV